MEINGFFMGKMGQISELPANLLHFSQV